MKTIDLRREGRRHPVDVDLYYLVDLEQGKELAEKVGLKDAVLAGPVDIILAERRERGYGSRRNVSESFAKGLVGGVARGVGIDLFFKRVSINGVRLDRNSCTWGFYDDVRRYLVAEEKRLTKAAKTNARKAGQTTWSAPGQLLIPDIGTVVQLIEDWTFRLYGEGRNNLLKYIGKDATGWREEMKSYEVTIRSGSELGVDRVYIRKGVGEYSSITFNLHKGGVIVFGGKEIKAQGRFWAKLSDVNRMKVQIDMNTLAEN